MHKFINKVLPNEPEIIFTILSEQILLGGETIWLDGINKECLQFKNLSALDYFMEWLKECRYEMIRLDYANATMPQQEDLQEYFDKNHLDEWIERAMDSYSQHDCDDVDFFEGKAWDMYLEH